MCIFNFGASQIIQVWNVVRHLDLSQIQHKFYGPVALLVWSCQILGWSILSDFQVEVAPGVLLHLLSAPKMTWHIFLEQAWVNSALNHFTAKQGKPFGNITISFRTWKSLLRRHKNLPPLSGKIRTFGLVSASAMANAKAVEEYHCAACGEAVSGTRHLALHCAGLADIRNDPKFRFKANPPEFTRCTEIPERPFIFWPSVPYTPELQQVFFPERTSFFADGSADPTDLPYQK